jgi:hypothetical protein
VQNWGEWSELCWLLYQWGNNLHTQWKWGYLGCKASQDAVEKRKSFAPARLKLRFPYCPACSPSLKFCNMLEVPSFYLCSIIMQKLQSISFLIWKVYDIFRYRRAVLNLNLTILYYYPYSAYSYSQHFPQQMHLLK